MRNITMTTQEYVETINDLCKELRYSSVLIIEEIIRTIKANDVIDRLPLKEEYNYMCDNDFILTVNPEENSLTISDILVNEVITVEPFGYRCYEVYIDGVKRSFRMDADKNLADFLQQVIESFQIQSREQLVKIALAICSIGGSVYEDLISRLHVDQYAWRR